MSREVFSTCNPLAINCVLFQEEARTTLWGAGIYYDGVTCWDVNSSGVITGTAACTTTTSTTSTTSTTTTTIGYELYTADRYQCVDNVCEFVETLQIGNPTVLNTSKFYYDYTNSYIFNIVGDPGAGPYLITSMSGAGTNNCNSLCSV
jgi:hypothetical protein